MNAAVLDNIGMQIPAGNASEREWFKCDETVSMKVLSVDVERNSVEVLVKIAAGFKSGRHRHTCETHAYFLQGRVINRTTGCSFGPGDYCYQPVNDEHIEEFPEETVAYVSYRGNSDKLLEFLDDDGNVCGDLKVSDFAAMI